MRVSISTPQRSVTVESVGRTVAVRSQAPRPLDRLDLTVRLGTTLRRVLRWETDPLTVVGLGTLVASAPARAITSTPHGLTDGWHVAVVSAEGLTTLNARSYPPTGPDFRRATVIDDVTVDFVTANASGDGPHVPDTGYLAFYSPADLSDLTMELAVGSVTLTDADGIVLDEWAQAITVTLSATRVNELGVGVWPYLLTATRGGDGVVTGLYHGYITVTEGV